MIAPSHTAYFKYSRRFAEQLTRKTPPLHNTGGGSAAGSVIMQIYEKLAQMGYIDANATTNKDSAKKTK